MARTAHGARKKILLLDRARSKPSVTLTAPVGVPCPAGWLCAPNTSCMTACERGDTALQLTLRGRPELRPRARRRRHDAWAPHGTRASTSELGSCHASVFLLVVFRSSPTARKRHGAADDRV
jgi:hypothetical protein